MRLSRLAKFIDHLDFLCEIVFIALGLFSIGLFCHFSQFVGAPFILQLLITCFSYVLQIFPLSYFLPSVYVYGTGCHTIFNFFNL